MGKIIKLVIIVLLTTGVNVHAQWSQSHPTALKQGGNVPEAFWQVQHQVYQNGQFKIQNFNNYKNKLLIIDFWASWCGSCLNKFKYMDSLQHRYGDKIIIILVNDKTTRDTPEKIATVMKRYNDAFISVVSDTILTKAFPHTSVPHYVWIAGNSLLATTGSDFFREATIDAILFRQKKLTNPK